MTDKVAALLRFEFQPGTDALAVIEHALATTRTFAGAERIDVLQSPDDENSWTLYEVWSSAEEEQAYRDFRAAPEGADPGLRDALAAPPMLERFVLRG